MSTALTVRRAGTLAVAGGVLVLAAAAPALAANPLGPSEGAVPGAGLSAGRAFLLFAAAPVALLLVVALVVWLPGMMRGTRYRPARGWGAAPVWFGGPVDPLAAVEAAEVGAGPRGGSSGDW